MTCEEDDTCMRLRQCQGLRPLMRMALHLVSYFTATTALYQSTSDDRRTRTHAHSRALALARV